MTIIEDAIVKGCVWYHTGV